MKRSALIVLSVVASSAMAEYSWQQSHATVLPTGNLEWAPRSFVFTPGDSIRYIDFEGGSDDNAGTKDRPWRHHPWDAQAGGQSKACRGVHTYVFKRGVVYRGALKATESGLPGNPIRLTSDPAWGTGAALFLGSTQIKGGWTKATAADAPGMPQPEQVWYNDVGKAYDPDRGNAAFSALWQVSGEAVERLHIAREPNYDLSDPNHPVANWHTWSGFRAEGRSPNRGTLSAAMLKGLGDRNVLDGAVIWTETSFLMAAPHKIPAKNYDPVAGTISLADHGGADYSRIPRAKVHFMVENVAQFLDAPGEYFYQAGGPLAGRLYLRPQPGTDPNSVVFEAAQVRFPIWIADQSHIAVSGLEFRYNDPDDGTYGYPYQIGASPCVRILGNCTDIAVTHCRFFHVADAVVAFPRPEKVDPPTGPYGVYSKEIGPFADDVMDGILIADNDLLHVEKAGAIFVTGASARKPGAVHGRLLRVDVLRNRVVDAGFRPDAGGNSSIPAISVVDPETCEVAGNWVDRSWGNGIFTHGGKSSPGHNTVPLTRMLVHANQVENTMLGCNDYGGLEHFQGGPLYLYNNVTRNCVGNQTLGKELGYSLYLDGGFKCYTFNNIIAGRTDPAQPDYYNHCGYFMVFGFMNQFFNNTIYRFDYAMDGSSGNRSAIVGNLLLDCAKSFLRQNRPGDVSMLGGGDTGAMGAMGVPTMAYSSNVFFGQPAGTGARDKRDAFGEIGGTRTEGGAPTYCGNTLEELRQALADMQCRLSDIGVMAPDMPLAAAAKHDYRPVPGSAAKERGVKFFVPWALARTVGEWNFHRSDAAPQTVLGEGFFMTDEYVDRGMYYHVPRNDLTVSACTAADYVKGPLEDWIEGALQFDGVRVATLAHADMVKSMTYPAGRAGTVAYDGSKRETLDMDRNNFLIEAHFRATGPGVLAEKLQATGYRLHVDVSGALTFTVGKDTLSGARVADGQWHHVVAEADREGGKLRLYVDGKLSAEGPVAAGSLANTADFVVGRGLAGAIDFLRVSRGTLADAKTTLEELYAWEFDGPHLRDFAGKAPNGRRTAGALEGAQ